MLGVVVGGTKDLAVRNGGPPRVVTSGSGTAALKCLWMLPVESCSPHTRTGRRRGMPHFVLSLCVCGGGICGEHLHWRHNAHLAASAVKAKRWCQFHQFRLNYGIVCLFVALIGLALPESAKLTQAGILLSPWHGYNVVVVGGHLWTPYVQLSFYKYSEIQYLHSVATIWFGCHLYCYQRCGKFHCLVSEWVFI